MARSKLLAQVKTIHYRGIEIGKAPKCRRNEIDLFDIGTAVGTGHKMQIYPDFGQDGKAIVQIIGGTICDIPAS